MREGGDTSPLGQTAPGPEAEPGSRGLMFGILVYRLASFALMVFLAAVVDLRSPTLTAVLLFVIGCWILFVSRLRIWHVPWVRRVDLLLSATVLVVGPFLTAPGGIERQPFFAAAYPLSTVMIWATARGVVGGLGAAVVLAVPLALSRRLNGTSFDELGLNGSLSVFTGTAYYLIGGMVVGLINETLGRAARHLRSANEDAAQERERAARLREREALARTIHDSVLQALAVVHRRGQELAARERIEPAEVRNLVDLVDRQERDLRTLLRGTPEDPPPGAVPLRTVLEAGAFGTTGVDISVSTVEPAWVQASDAAEISSAVRAALDNVVRHASATHATIFGEVDSGELVVSIRDDGVGFDVDEPKDTRNGRFGIARSIRGRIEDLGGEVRIDSAPGRGTEVELRVPSVVEGSTS